MVTPVPYRISTHGKLLLTGEYFVLDGAKALAVPTSRGQKFEVNSTPNPAILHWQSYDESTACWFEAKFSLPTLAIIKTTDKKVALQLIRILKIAKKASKYSFPTQKGLRIETHLAFPRNWGLGSSSTLITAIAQWLAVDAFDLLFKSFGGSGYDIACALHDVPILYQLKNGQPLVETCHFSPSFKKYLYFVHLGKKQDSKEGIQYYRAMGKKDAGLIAQVSHLTMAIFEAKNLAVFENLLLQHENLIAQHLHLTNVQKLYFENFPGVIKSLGAWGGDFVLVTSQLGDVATKKWFAQKAYPTVLRYDEMVFVNKN